MTIEEMIKAQLTENPIILYMKGTAEMPKCGFSARAANLLKACGAKFACVDVLANDEIRHGIKQYSDWPTIPQLYIRGEFIGGSDIIAEMYESGELQKIVQDLG